MSRLVAGFERSRSRSRQPRFLRMSFAGAVYDEPDRMAVFDPAGEGHRNIRSPARPTSCRPVSYRRPRSGAWTRITTDRAETSPIACSSPELPSAREPANGERPELLSWVLRDGDSRPAIQWWRGHHHRPPSGLKPDGAAGHDICPCSHPGLVLLDGRSTYPVSRATPPPADELLSPLPGRARRAGTERRAWRWQGDSPARSPGPGVMRPQ
jgi:hypothetical protein